MRKREGLIGIFATDSNVVCEVIIEGNKRQIMDNDKTIIKDKTVIEKTLKKVRAIYTSLN